MNRITPRILKNSSFCSGLQKDVKAPYEKGLKIAKVALVVAAVASVIFMTIVALGNTTGVSSSSNTIKNPEKMDVGPCSLPPFQDIFQHFSKKVTTSIGKTNLEGDSVTTYKIGDGSFYTGGLKNGLADGAGLQIWPNKCEYTGYFREGRMNGPGFYKCPVKKYEGGFKDKGWNHTDSVGEYIGIFENDQFHGLGSLHWSDKRQFYGQFQNNTAHGPGALFCSDGQIYRGNFENNEIQNGQGKWISANGTAT